MKIVVIGGSGRVGSNVVRRLEAQGHDAVAASPATGVDTITGEGLADVMTGADAVIDVVGNRQTLEAGIQALAIGGKLVLIGAKPQSVYGEDPSFMLDPGSFMHRGLELHSSRYVNAAEIALTLELVRDKRITPVVTQTFALDQVEQAHELIRNNATTGRIALVLED